MKKKEVIHGIAFEGIPPAQQITGEMELSDAALIPGTPGNMELVDAGRLKVVLEKALPDKHDDDEVDNPGDYDKLETALNKFKRDVLLAIMFPEVIHGVEEDFARKMAVLIRFREEGE